MFLQSQFAYAGLRTASGPETSALAVSSKIQEVAEEIEKVGAAREYLSQISAIIVEVANDPAYQANIGTAKAEINKRIKGLKKESQLIRVNTDELYPFDFTDTDPIDVIFVGVMLGDKKCTMIIQAKDKELGELWIQIAKNMNDALPVVEKEWEVAKRYAVTVREGNAVSIVKQNIEALNNMIKDDPEALKKVEELEQAPASVVKIGKRTLPNLILAIIVFLNSYMLAVPEPVHAAGKRAVLEQLKQNVPGYVSGKPFYLDKTRVTFPPAMEDYKLWFDNHSPNAQDNVQILPGDPAFGGAGVDVTLNPSNPPPPHLGYPWARSYVSLMNEFESSVLGRVKFRIKVDALPDGVKFYVKGLHAEGTGSDTDIRDLDVRKLKSGEWVEFDVGLRTAKGNMRQISVIAENQTQESKHVKFFVAPATEASVLLSPQGAAPQVSVAKAPVVKESASAQKGAAAAGQKEVFTQTSPGTPVYGNNNSITFPANPSEYGGWSSKGDAKQAGFIRAGGKGGLLKGRLGKGEYVSMFHKYRSGNKVGVIRFRLKGRVSPGQQVFIRYGGPQGEDRGRRVPISPNRFNANEFSEIAADPGMIDDVHQVALLVESPGGDGEVELEVAPSEGEAIKTGMAVPVEEVTTELAGKPGLFRQVISHTPVLGSNDPLMDQGPAVEISPDFTTFPASSGEYRGWSEGSSYSVMPGDPAYGGAVAEKQVKGYLSVFHEPGDRYINKLRFKLRVTLSPGQNLISRINVQRVIPIDLTKFKKDKNGFYDVELDVGQQVNQAAVVVEGPGHAKIEIAPMASPAKIGMAAPEESAPTKLAVAKPLPETEAVPEAPAETAAEVTTFPASSGEYRAWSEGSEYSVMPGNPAYGGVTVEKQVSKYLAVFHEPGVRYIDVMKFKLRAALSPGQRLVMRINIQLDRDQPIDLKQFKKDKNGFYDIEMKIGEQVNQAAVVVEGPGHAKIEIAPMTAPAKLGMAAPAEKAPAKVAAAPASAKVEISEVPLPPAKAVTPQEAVKKIMPQVQKAVNWLTGRFRAQSGLVDSYDDEAVTGKDEWFNKFKPSAHLFDQTLWAMAMDSLGAHEQAAKVLETMTRLQKPDGSFHINYDSRNRSMLFHEQHIGPIAFVVMAVNFHVYATGGLKKGDRRFIDMAKKAADYLITKQRDTGAITSPEWVSCEENMDTYSALYNLSKITGEQKYLDKANELKKFIQTLWDNDQGYFYMGLKGLTPEPNKDLAYDTSVWGYILFGGKGENGEDYGRGLDYVIQRQLAQPDTGITHYANQVQELKRMVFWIDPTMWYAIARLKQGRLDEAQRFFSNMLKFQNPKTGGFPANEWKDRVYNKEHGIKTGIPKVDNAPDWPIFPLDHVHPAAAAIFYLKTLQDPKFNIFMPSEGVGTPINGLKVGKLPGMDMVVPGRELAVTHEETRKEIDGALAAGVKTKAWGKAVAGAVLNRQTGKLERTALTAGEAAALDEKMSAVEKIIGTISLENLPFRKDGTQVTYDELIKALQGAELFFVKGLTVGKDIFSHTGKRFGNRVYLCEDMVAKLSPEEVSELLLEEAKHLVLDDPEHALVTHGKAIRKKMVSIYLKDSERVKEIERDMLADPTVKAGFEMGEHARAKDPAAADRMTVVYLTVDPYFVVNLEKEIAKRGGRKDFKVIPVYNDDNVSVLDHVKGIQDAYKGIVLKPVSVDDLRKLKQDGQPLEVAAIAFARQEFPEAGMDPVDIGWINSSQRGFGIEGIVADPLEPQIFEMVPVLPVDREKEILNVGLLFDLMDTAIVARRAAGADFTKITFKEIEKYLADDVKEKFKEAVKALGIADQKVFDYVQAPLPVVSATKTLTENVNALTDVMSAA